MSVREVRPGRGGSLTLAKHLHRRDYFTHSRNGTTVQTSEQRETFLGAMVIHRDPCVPSSVQCDTCEAQSTRGAGQVGRGCMWGGCAQHEALEGRPGNGEGRGEHGRAFRHDLVDVELANVHRDLIQAARINSQRHQGRRIRDQCVADLWGHHGCTRSAAAGQWWGRRPTGPPLATRRWWRGRRRRGTAARLGRRRGRGRRWRFRSVRRGEGRRRGRRRSTWLGWWRRRGGGGLRCCGIRRCVYGDINHVSTAQTHKHTTP